MTESNQQEVEIREVTYSCEGWSDTWVYNCGWHIKGEHPYRMIFFGEQMLNQPIGIGKFYEETGILPPNKPIKLKAKEKLA